MDPLGIFSYKGEDGVNVADIPITLTEIAYAEDNWAQIQAAAVKMNRDVFSKLKGSRFDTSELDFLIKELNTTYASIRGRIVTAFQNQPNLNLANLVAGRRLATSTDHYPRLPDLRCFCPLTVFLQIVARSLSNVKINIAIDTNKLDSGPRKGKDKDKSRDGWGTIKPLRDVIVRLNQTLRRISVPRHGGGGRKNTCQYVPGVAQCLMLHEENSRYTVTSSSVQYTRLQGLGDFCRRTRVGRIERMRRSFSPATIARIEEVECGSRLISEQFNARKGVRTKNTDWNDPFDGDIEPVRIVGQSGTFDPTGKYKLACLLDFCRFLIERPEEAAKAENDKVATDARNGHPDPKRQAYEIGACAEWEMWMTILSTEASAATTNTTVPRPVARRGGQQRSDTYPPRPAPQVASKRPSHPSLQFQASAAQQKVTPPKPSKAPSRPTQGAYNQQYLSPQPPGGGHHGKPGYASSSSRTPSPSGYVRPEPMQIGQPKPKKKQSSGCC